MAYFFMCMNNSSASRRAICENLPGKGRDHTESTHSVKQPAFSKRFPDGTQSLGVSSPFGRLKIEASTFLCRNQVYVVWTTDSRGGQNASACCRDRRIATALSAGLSAGLKNFSIRIAGKFRKLFTKTFFQRGRFGPDRGISIFMMWYNRCTTLARRTSFIKEVSIETRSNIYVL